jgi:rfaE bifunctional protein kinase chain/domain
MLLTIDQSRISAEKTFAVENLASLEGRKVLVVGDLGLDEYLDGEVRRISPEAPVPVVEVRTQEYRVGLAANVAQNIHSLGGVGLLVGLVGADDTAKLLGGLLKQNGVSDQHLIHDEQRPTTRKVRVMSGQHHVVRVDFEERKYLSPEVESRVLQKVEPLLATAEGLILQDYGKGVLSEGLTQELIALAQSNGKKVVVDPHRTTPVRYYRGADLIKPNRDEAFILSGLNVDDLQLRPDSILEVGRAIQAQTRCPNLIITQGKSGVTLFQGEQISHIPTEPRQVYDVTGAGDTYLAAFCLAWFGGYDPITAAVMANAASGVVVGKIGSVPCTKAELLAALS